MAEAATAVRGDVDAFGALYDRHFDDVYRYSLAMTGHRQTAEDITADTFVRALRSLPEFRCTGPDSARSWLLVIARNLARDRWKSAWCRREVPAGLPEEWWRVDTAPPVEVVADRVDQARELMRGVRQLTADQRECIVLRFWLHMTTAETAATMGRPVRAIIALQYRAVRALARQLQESAPALLAP